MTISCPNCGVAGPNLNCNLHPMPKFGNMTNPCKEIPQPIIDEEKRWLFAETAGLSLRLRTAELHAHTMEAKILELQAAGVIDHMGRKLPLPGHHKDCPHGQNGWAMCTCEELEARDVRNAKAFDRVFDDLIDEGQELRKKFDKDTAGMRGAPNCPKCGDTGLISYGPGTRGMKRCDCQIQRLVEEDEFTRVMNETYEHLPPRPRDPRQDLKPGDHVRFEIEGIIKERQSAGIFQDEDGDFEPIQYAIKDSINGMTYYVGYHQITKKIGSVE